MCAEAYLWYLEALGPPVIKGVRKRSKNKVKKKEKMKGGQARENINRKVNQHDKRAPFKHKQGFQWGRGLQGCQINEGGEGDILQLCSKMPKLLTHCPPGVRPLRYAPGVAGRKCSGEYLFSHTCTNMDF